MVENYRDRHPYELEKEYPKRFISCMHDCNLFHCSEKTKNREIFMICHRMADIGLFWAVLEIGSCVAVA